MFLEQKRNQRLPTFRVVFKLSEVPSVERERGRGKRELLTQVFASKCPGKPAYSVCVRMCVLLFLLVVGHSPAGEDHCGEDGES